MLTVQNISKTYGVETILSSISFDLNRGERMALVGPNGCGKTTLLRILVGEESPDAGAVLINRSDLRLGYLPQGFQPNPEDTLGSFLANMQDGLPELSKEVERLASTLVNQPQASGLQKAYDAALNRLQQASESTNRIPQVLGALGLGEYPLNTPVSTLSGGQKTRLALARVLLDDPHLLLLDEPTNHLDLEMLEWLEDWLNGFSGAALVVSHDRFFLDRMATTILEIDMQTHTARQYTGNYTDYLEQKLSEKERQRQEYHDQQEEIARLRSAVVHIRSTATFKRGGKADSGDKFAKGFFANRSKGTVRRAKNIEQRIERMLTDDKVEKPRQSWQMKLEFNDTHPSSRDVLALENLSVGYGENILLEGLDQVLRYGARAVLVGPNGSGKTTLLRTMIGKIAPLAGRVRLGASVRTGYMAQEQEDLQPQLDAFQSLRSLAPLSETEARAFLHRFLFSGDDVFIPVGSLSYGERARLSLACLVAKGCNFLLLDEPINHLDIPSRTRFEQALAPFEGTVLAVVHDRYFIEGFATEIWEVQGKSIRRRWVR